ncbi:MAG: hypothetical protein AB8B89_05125 [Gammaproteobacteria bacterium]
MKELIAALIIAISASTLCADEIPNETKSVIDELLVLTKAIEIGEMMGVGVSNQVIQALSESGKKK